MSKIRFYVDVPEFSSYQPGWLFMAMSKQPSYQPPAGFKRVFFDVDLPPEVFKPTPMISAQTSGAGIVSTFLESNDAEITESRGKEGEETKGNGGHVETSQFVPNWADGDSSETP